MNVTANGRAQRVAPHNLQAEEHLLGAMLLSREAIAAGSEACRPADFYKPAHVHIYDAILSLYGSGEPVDPVTVGDEMMRAGTLDTIGGPGFLVGLQAGAPAISNAGRYGRIIEELALLRRMIGAAGEIAELGYSMPDDVAKAVDAAQQMFLDLSVGQQDTVRNADQMVHETLDELERLYAAGSAITGSPTGYLDVDELLSGLQPGTVTTICAATGGGKTAFALGAAAHVAIHERRPVWVQEWEMNHMEMMGRIISSEARVDSTRIRNGRLNSSDWEKIAHTTERVATAPIWVDDDPNATLLKVRSNVRRLKASTGDCGLVVLDHAGIVNAPGQSDFERVSFVSRAAKILAKELHVPVMLLAQLNRGVDQRSDKRPTLADLRSSGTLAQDADNVIALYRDELYNRDSADLGMAEVIVLKQRSGPTGVVRLAFLGQFAKFANMARS